MRYLVLLLALTGCATPEQRADRMLERFGPICTRLGFEPETDKWRECVLAQGNTSTLRRAIQ